MRWYRLAPAFMTLLFCVAAHAYAAPQYVVEIRNHRFEPARLRIPAGTKIRLLVKNADSTPEEFESIDFNREKLVMGHDSTIIYIGPLRAGSYRFFGDFHQATAQGRLIVE